MLCDAGRLARKGASLEFVTRPACDREGPEGSNPSPSAYLRVLGIYSKANESKKQGIENLKI